MKGRITTRAGRKIRHVAPGHVVDVATGLDVERMHVALWNSDSWRVGGLWGKEYRRLDPALRAIIRAEAVCVLVRYLVLSWQENRS